MSMKIKPGSRLFSAVCATEMIAIKAPAGDAELTIGGATPVAAVAERDSAVGAADGFDGGAAMGKRYVDEAGTIELLCTKAGQGVPALAGELLQLKEAKALPSSD
jgi:hypothetical protein